MTGNLNLPSGVQLLAIKEVTVFRGLKGNTNSIDLDLSVELLKLVFENSKQTPIDETVIEKIKEKISIEKPSFNCCHTKSREEITIIPASR